MRRRRQSICLLNICIHSEYQTEREEGGERGPFLPLVFGPGGKIENALDAQLGLGARSRRSGTPHNSPPAAKKRCLVLCPTFTLKVSRFGHLKELSVNYKCLNMRYTWNFEINFLKIKYLLGYLG